MKNGLAKIRQAVSLYHYFNDYLGFLMFACAAAKRAIGTLNGEQLT
jgi:hypothetical protein